MKPMGGMTGGYFNEKCSLKVEVVSYEEADDMEIIRLRVLKNLSKNPGCSYEEGSEFVYSRKKGEEKNGLEGLTLE